MLAIANHIIEGPIVNKTELIDRIAESADISKAAAARSVDTVLEVITDSLKKGNAVTLVGFGTFNTRRREARTGRNPRTGEPIQIGRAPAATDVDQGVGGAVHHQRRVHDRGGVTGELLGEG